MGFLQKNETLVLTGNYVRHTDFHRLGKVNFEHFPSLPCPLMMSTRPRIKAPNQGMVSSMIVLPASVLQRERERERDRERGKERENMNSCGCRLIRKRPDPIPTAIWESASSALPELPDAMIMAESGTAPRRGRTTPPIIAAGRPRSNSSSAPSMSRERERETEERRGERIHFNDLCIRQTGIVPKSQERN